MSHQDPIEEDVFRHLSTNVRRLRLAAGLTLKKAAERADMNWLRLRKIEEGQINVTVLTLVRLGQALGVDPATLLSERKREMT